MPGSKHCGERNSGLRGRGIPQRADGGYVKGMTTPALFISHGSPMLALGNDEARLFLQRLGAALDKPRAILIASAHDDQPGPVVRAPERFRTWHDFGNFDRRLFEMRYEPSGAGDVAVEAKRLLNGSGIPAQQSSAPQLDHGAWIPLWQMWPGADVPLATLSIDSRRDAAWHEAVGRAVAPLREQGVLVIGSGSISHNLHEVFRGGGDKAWVERFTDWLVDHAEAGDRPALLRTMEEAPDAARNHPTDEHFLPFFVALGAGGTDGVARRLHHSFTHDVLAMDAYAFGDAETVEKLASDLQMVEHAGQ